MPGLTRLLPDVGILYGSGLFKGDEQCFQLGQTYEVRLAKVPQILDAGKAAVIYRDGVIYGWLMKSKATSTQLQAFEEAMGEVRCGMIVKVTINSAGGLSKPKYDDRVGRYREWCHGTASCWSEPSPLLVQNVRVKTLIGQVDISFGSKLYPASQEAPFVRGAQYALKEERVSWLGGEGTALKQEDPTRHSGYVSRQANDVVQSYLRRGIRVVAEVTSAREGNRGIFCGRLRALRDWWNGRALCWVDERFADLESIWDPDYMEDVLASVLPEGADDKGLSGDTDE